MLNKPTGDMLNAAGSATPQGLGTASAGTATAYSREDHVHAIPTLSGDVTNNGAAVTVAKIQGSAVSSSTPANGQVLTWDGTQWAPAQGTGGGGGGGANGLTYYLNQSTAADAPTTGIAGTPHQLGRSGESAQTTLTSGTLTQNVWTLLAGFVSESTPIDPDVTLIPAGLWDFNVWAYGDANTNAGTSIRCSVYKYNGSTLTQIGSPSSDQVINGTSAQYSLSVLVPQTTLELTDRIYVAIEARATGSNHSVTLEFGDSTPSHVHTSLPLVGGTGLWKSVAGVLQSPASLLVNADVDANAGISWSKIAPSYLGAQVKIVGRDSATIQGCIDLCTDADADHNYTILIPPTLVSYSENLTLKGSVSLVGITTALNSNGVQITGAHTFAPAFKNQNSNRIGFENITFVSSSNTANTVTVSSSKKYTSILRFNGCTFSGDKSNTYSHIATDDNVSLYVDNCRFESIGGGIASAAVTQGNGPIYFSNNTQADVYGRVIDVPVSTTTTRTSSITNSSATLTLTSGTTSGLVVGQKISGSGIPTGVTIDVIVDSTTITMSSTATATVSSFTATFGQTPYVELHDSVLKSTGAAEVVRLGNGLLTCNTSNFTNTATGGSGINLQAAGTVAGIINSSFTIYDTSKYTITGENAYSYAAFNSVSYSTIPGASFSGAYNTAFVIPFDYTSRATSVQNGGTGATTPGQAVANLGVGMRMVEANAVSNVAGTMNTGVTPNTFTVTATGAFSADGYPVVVGDIVAFVAQSTATQNGFWEVTVAGATGVQAKFQRPSWYSVTGKNTLTTPRFGAAQTGYLTAVFGPAGNTDIAIGTASISCARYGTKVTNATVASNTFTNTQIFSAGNTGSPPVRFQAGVVTTTPTAHNLEWDGTFLYSTTSGAVRTQQAAFVPAPATASSTGVAGQIAYDSTGIYVCVAANTWRKAALATF